MLTEIIDGNANYANLGQGYSFPPPQVAASTSANPPMVLPYAAYNFSKAIEPTRPGYDQSGNKRHGIFNGARPGQNYMTFGAADSILLPFSAADVMAAGGYNSMTVIALLNLPPACVTRIISNYQNSVAIPSIFATATAVSGTSTNLTAGHTETAYHDDPIRDVNRGGWGIYAFEWSGATLAGASQNGKLDISIIAAGQSVVGCPEADAYPVEQVTGGTGQLSFGAPYTPDSGIAPTGGMLMHSALIYPFGMTTYLEPQAVLALELAQQWFRVNAAVCGIVI